VTRHSKSISAIPVKAVEGSRSRDGKYGLLFLDRDRPDSGGRERLNLALKTELLPTVAAVCLGLIDPRQTGEGGRRSRALTPTKQVEIGVANNGQLALTFWLETGGAISFGLDCTQACNLAEALVELAQEAGGTPRALVTIRPKAA
jgi:hypothetical protein